jgi:cytochrome c5
MKKTVIILSLGIFAFACSPKTAPTTTSTETKTSAPEPATAGVSASSTATTMIEAGHTVYDTRCGRCHGLKDVTKYTAQQWDGILKAMIPKAKLDETQAAQVTAYVMANARK